MSHDAPRSLANLLPHAEPMLLIDRVVDWEPGQISVGVTITAQSRFSAGAQGVPSYVGLEYMAQTCGTYAGLEGTKDGRPVRMGFLLGTREYRATVSHFPPGAVLMVTAKEISQNESVGLFDCRIFLENNEVASAQLNLYQPDTLAGIVRNA